MGVHGRLGPSKPLPLGASIAQADARVTDYLRCHILPRLGREQLGQFGPENLQAFVSALSRQHSRKTIVNVLATLSVILNTAKLWGYICEGISVRQFALPARGEKGGAKCFSAEQARQIIAAALEPYATAFAVAAMTGVRPGELFGLKVEDLNFERRIILIRRSVRYGKLQTPKSESSVRALPMPEPLTVRLRSYLEKWKPNSLGLLFASRRGTPLSANNVVQRKPWPILDALGIPRCGLHAFRHTHSSLLLDVGAPATVAQAQLGHSDPRITLGVYSHVIGDSHRQKVERVAQLLGSQLDPSGPKHEGTGKWIQ